MKTFFLCSIGPVQDFIATARKSSDLWYGSWLLSELAKSAAKWISDQQGFNTLIFPCPKDRKLLEPGSQYNVPNKIMAELDDFNSAIGEKVREAIKTRLMVLWNEASKGLKAGDLDTGVLADEQIKSLVEFYWVAVPYDETTVVYHQAREQAEALLAARKNTRDFTQLNGSNKPKSSLDGFRESVIPKSAFPVDTDDERGKENKVQALYRKYRAREAEQLSGVDLLKRLGMSTIEHTFPSTSDLAASSLFTRMNDKREEELINAIKNAILSTHIWNASDISEDRSLVFESRLVEYFPSKEGREEARKILSDILQQYLGDIRPNPYYALLIADGDNMGKLIDSKRSPEEHRKLSDLISSFAIDAPMIIEKHAGACIYAGGEDILAYLPLQNALACVYELHERFDTLMVGQSFVDVDGSSKKPSLSGGIVIAHHLTPLSDVFELARKAERKAKLVKGKNTLAIILSKRSGSDKLVKGKWSDMIVRLEKLVEMYRKGWISSGTAYEFQQLHLDLSGIGILHENEALNSEALRIIRRKRQSKSDEKLTANVLKQFETWFLTDMLSVSELAQEMIIAKEFAGSEELAQKPIKEVLKCKNG